MGKALLIIVVGFSTIFSGMMFNATSRQQLAARAIVHQYDKWVARNVVESATNVALSKLYRDFDWRAGYSDQSFAGATYSVTVTDITADSTNEAKKIQVKTIATYADEIDSTIAVTMQPAYSYYQYFVNDWRPQMVAYDDGDTLSGPVHANDEIPISNSPVFLDKVSSDESDYFHDSTPAPKFYGGLDFGTSTIDMPDLTGIIASATAAGDVFDYDVWLTFYQNGSYDFAISDEDPPLGNRLISDANGTIVTTEGHDVHVKGTLDGAVSIISRRDLFIEDDLVYATNPLDDLNSDDYLGLIAERNVVVPDNDIVDIDVHAAIVALHHFKVTNYDEGSPRGTLTIVGSMALEHDHESGTYSGGTLEHGFERIHENDPRLRDKTPPFFPRLNRVELLLRGN